MPYSGGLKRNIVQCLNDFDIPLKLSHTVVDIKGKERVESVTIAQVDDKLTPIPGTEEEYKCDTLLLSCGLIPENELSNGAGIGMNPVTNGPKVNESMETDVPGIFACGNVLHVHDLVDYVSEEAGNAGAHAAMYCLNGDRAAGDIINVTTANGVRYTVPSIIRPGMMGDALTIRFRVGNVYKNCYVDVFLDGERIIHRKRPVVAPGEMENVVIKKEMLEGKTIKELNIRLDLNEG